MATKLTLSREYVYIPIEAIGFAIGDLNLHRLAFIASPAAQPIETDWIDAIVVDSAHALFDPAIGESIALLIGPDRGDPVTTETLGVGDFATWVEVSTATSDERVVRIAGTLTVADTAA